MQEEKVVRRIMAIQAEVSTLLNSMKREKVSQTSFRKHLEQTYTVKSWRKPKELACKKSHVKGMAHS